MAIHSIDHFLQSRKIFLITKSEVFEEIKTRTRPDMPLYFLNEDELIDGLSLAGIQAILKNRMKTEIRGNWYFQQIIKMAVSQLPEIAEHYLIWDSDTNLLRPLTFFDKEGHIFFNPKKENHQPYFQFLLDLLDIEKQV
ncbi:MAG: hypothetical protein GVY07_00345, partial [Bacteroidetes bacterium]|nr:hypothetical protein [Bacteroidota bacterium]